MTSPVGTRALNALGMDVFFTGALTGHNSTIAVGSGSFTWVNDKSSSGNVTLTGTTQATNDATSGWQTAAVYAGTTPGTRTIAGLTVTGSSDSAITGMGVRYGGTVTISGVTSASPAGSLRYIEGVGIGVLTTASSFNGSLTLVNNGGGVQVSVNNAFKTGGIVVGGTTLAVAGDLTLVHQGTINAEGIHISGATVTAGGNLFLTQTGVNFAEAIKLDESNLTAVGNLVLTQQGNSAIAGITVTATILTAGKDLSLLQLGRIIPSLTPGANPSAVNRGIGLVWKGVNANQITRLTAGTSGQVTIKTNDKDLVLFNGTAGTTGTVYVTRAKLRIDLGSGALISHAGNGAIQSGGFVLDAAGLDVVFTGSTASSSHNAKIAVGGGSFLTLTDRSNKTTLTSLSSSTLATDSSIGWDLGFSGTTGTTASGITSYARNGLTVTTTGTGADARVKGIGVKYGSGVSIDGVTAASDAGKLTYIEGALTRTTTAASSFNGSLTLVTSSNATDGVYINGNLTIGTTGDGVSNLTLIHSKDLFAASINFAANIVVRVGGSITLSQTGSGGLSSIFLNTGVSLTAGGSITMYSSANTRERSIILIAGTLTAAGDITMTQTANSSAPITGIFLEQTRLTAGGNITIKQLASAGTVQGGIQLVASAANQVSLTAGTGKTVSLTAKSGITLKTTDNFAVLGGSRLDIDVGSSTIRSLNAASAELAAGSGFTLGAAGMDVFFSGATTGNNAKIAVGGGSFTFLGRPAVSGSLTISNSTALSDLGLSGVNYSGSTAGTRTVAGNLVITGTNDRAISGLGVKHEGLISIQGVSASSVNGRLSYLEGTSIATAVADSSFAGSLTLVTSGNSTNNGIAFGANLTVGTVNDRVSNLTLLQTNTVSEFGFRYFVGIIAVTAGGSITMVQSGDAGWGAVNFQPGSSMVAGGSISLTASGKAGQSSLSLKDMTLTAAGNVTVTQTASATATNGFGIAIEKTNITAGGDITLSQLGTITVSGKEGIRFLSSSTSPADRSTFTAGANRAITLTAKSGIKLGYVDNFTFAGASRLVMNLGSSTITSFDAAGGAVAAGNGSTLNAAGMDVFFTGATTGNNAKFAVGAGSFTFVNDLSSRTTEVTLSNTTTAADVTNGWGTTATYGGSAGNRTIGGLTITGSRDAALQGTGVRYGGVVKIQGVTAAATTGVNNLTYIEGSAVSVADLASSVFAKSLTLVSTGAGYDSGTTIAGINRSILDLTVNGDLNLIQTGTQRVTMASFFTSGVNVTATGGSMTLNQSGTAGKNGINIAGKFIQFNCGH